MVPNGQYQIKVIASRTFGDVTREATASTILNVEEGDPPQISFRSVFSSGYEND